MTSVVKNGRHCQREYQEDKLLKEGDVTSFLDWANKQPHLPKIDELLAILFLQSCYYSNEAAKVALDNFFTVRTLCPEIFLGRNPSLSPLKEALDVALFSCLPKKTPEGHTIVLAKLIDPNPDNYNFALQLKYFDMGLMSHLCQQGTSQGHVIVMDMRGVVFGHLTKLGPLTMRKFLFYLQAAMPLRLKGLHYFNIVSFMDKILALMRPFMKKELLDVLHLHNSVEGLLDFVPRECLPEDYGGGVESIAVLHEKVKQRIHDNIEFFEAEDRMTVEENLRPGKPKNVGDVFGVEGTFKKLELD